MNQIRMTLAAIAVCWGMETPNMFAQDGRFTLYQLETGSRLWLEGSATVGDFTCGTERIEGMAKLRVHSAEHGDSSMAKMASDEVHVSLLVKKFDCGNNAMNNDMYDAMKADSAPWIQYELKEASIMADSQAIDSMRKVNTRGQLSIAGVTKDVSMIVTILRLSPTHFRIVGSKVLSMHEFSITPPTALWGMIEAHDTLVVRFDLVAGMEPPPEIGSVKK